MKLAVYQVDAFADNVFEGNPAAICPLNEWLTDSMMQSIANENNLSETAFIVPMEEGADYHIRWFTPVREVDLCGHATLAAAHILFSELGYAGKEISFLSHSGILKVMRNDEWLEMDFPSQPPVSAEIINVIQSAFDEKPAECLRGQDHIVVFDHEDQVRNADPDMNLLQELDLRGVAITAKGDTCDFVTRFFAPKYGINEDPVTGSAFTQLIPYWVQRTGKQNLVARQISSRGGTVRCCLDKERVKISGKAVTYLAGRIEI